MPTTVLGLLGLLLCALAVSSEVTPQPDFDIKRVAGKWYLIGIATSAEWFVTCKADMKMGVAMLTPTDEGDLEMAYSSLNPDGINWSINQFVNKSDFPGIFSYRSERRETYHNISFVDVKYDEYALIHTVKTKDDSTTVVNKLYGRTPHLSQVVLDKFTVFSRNQSILLENIAILPKNEYSETLGSSSFSGGHWSAISEPWTPVKPVTPEVKEICNEVKSDIQKMVGPTFQMYNPLSFASQILVEGTEYVVKVEIGPDECVHAMVSVTYSYGTRTTTVLRIQHPKAIIDPLVPF